MALLQHSSRLLALPAVLLFCFLYTADLSAQNKVTFSLQNRQTDTGVYSAELWATVSSSATWQPGNCIITINFNQSALSVGQFNNAGLLDPDAAINSGGYMPMYQSLYDGILSVNIINLSGNFATKSGSFRIGTLRWAILNGFLQDSLRFETAGNGASIVGDGWNTMDYNCGNDACYGAVNPTPAQTGNPPVITQQPESVGVCVGSPATLSVSALAALTYQWELLNNAVWQPIAGATTSTLAFAGASADNEGSYRVVLTGNAPPVATSLTVVLTLMSAPAIVSQPAAATACEGSPVVFATAFSGSPVPEVAWQINSGTGWANIPNATGATFTIPTAEALMNGNQYRALIANACGSTTSTPATLTVLTAPAITTQSTIVTATVGDNTSLGVTATGAGLGYRWQKNTIDILGVSTATLAIANAQAGDIGLYRAIVTGTCGEADTSDQMLLIVQAVDTTKTTLVVKALMQGYWDGTTHVRTPVSVELRVGQTPLTSTIASIQAGILQSNGTITVEFSDIQSGNYWIVVRHGGYLPAASAAAVAVTRGSTTSYDFSDAASKAYVNSTIAVSIGGQVYYVLKGGDLNGNRSVNPQDLPLFLVGYPKTNASVVPGL